MILEMDCGNSYIKWRVLSGIGGAGVAHGVSAQVGDVIRAILGSDVGPVTRGRLVSVRGDGETQAIIDAISTDLNIRLDKAHSEKAVAGVVNGYRDHQRLGLDRWLAIVAAYDMCRGACLVIDLGTAITVDYVAHDGTHLGGYIAPGVAILRAKLLDHTRRIRYDAAEAELALRNVAPGQSTAEAVERGCLIMARSYISTQIAAAADYMEDGFVTFVTGGDAALATDLPGVKYVPDLVFRGLAIACP